MIKRSLFLIGLVTLALATASAEPVSLNRSEAFELHTALSQLAPGLSPENTLAASDDINALDGAAKSFRSGYAKVLQLQALADAAKTPEALKEFREADAKFAAAVEEKKAYDLTPIVFTKEEVKASNITAASLAVIKRLLKPDIKPETKK